MKTGVSNAPEWSRTINLLIRSQKKDSKNSKKTGVLQATPTKFPTNGAHPTPTPTADPSLSALIAAWPTLPAAIRAGIVAMVGASKDRG